MYLAAYTTDLGNTFNSITISCLFTESSKIGTRDKLIEIVGNTYFNSLKFSEFPCPYCFGKPRKSLITTSDGYQVEAEVPFTFASLSWQSMLLEINSNPKVIGIENIGERISNHYLNLWL